MTNIDSMGVAREVPYMERVPANQHTGAEPGTLHLGQRAANFYEGVIQAHTPISDVLTGVAGPLPFDPFALVPGDARGTTLTRWGA